MVGDDIDAARLQGCEHRLVHRRPVHAHVAEVVVVEHQRHQIESRVGKLQRHRIGERPRHCDNAGRLRPRALEAGIARSECLGRGPRRWSCCLWGRWRCRGRIAVALRRCRRRAARIARLALAVNCARRSDRAGQQLGRVAAGGAEIECGDARTDADERQHLLRLAAQVVGAICSAAIRAVDDRRNLLGGELWSLLSRRCAGSEPQSRCGQRREESFGAVIHQALLGYRLPSCADQ
jgi:hypothetical protein